MLSNDLFEFMVGTADEIAREYRRIQTRATADAGTAGDQGEENWAALLRDWLPPLYQVTTKGRILGYHGRASRQVDVIVLHPTYPKRLLDKKLYLAGGVAAAFECKVTLKGNHIATAMQNAAGIRRLLRPRLGTPYKELNSPLIYGLLAHSHGWTGKRSLPIANIDRYLNDTDRQFIQHPREMIDVLCVADLSTWVALKSTLLTLSGDDILPPDVHTSYMRHPRPDKIEPGGGYVAQPRPFEPIGKMLSYLLMRLAWEDAQVRLLAEYFDLSRVGGVGGGGVVRQWSLDVYSDYVRTRLAPDVWKSLVDGEWNEWSVYLY